MYVIEGSGGGGGGGRGGRRQSLFGRLRSAAGRLASRLRGR
jgi:hypothetical protein